MQVVNMQGKTDISDSQSHCNIVTLHLLLTLPFTSCMFFAGILVSLDRRGPSAHLLDPAL